MTERIERVYDVDELPPGWEPPPPKRRDGPVDASEFKRPPRKPWRKP